MNISLFPKFFLKNLTTRNLMLNLNTKFLMSLPTLSGALQGTRE